MINVSRIVLLFFVIYVCINNNYYYTISHNEFTKKLTNESVLYKTNENLCLFNHTNYMMNNYYLCSNYEIKSLIDNIDIAENKILPIKFTNYSEFLTLSNLLIVLIIVVMYMICSCFLNLSHTIGKTKINNEDSSNPSNPFNQLNPFNNTPKVTVHHYYPANNDKTLDNFIGCDNIKKDVSELITQIKDRSFFANNDCQLPKGILLLGPPGCGKTHLVKTIINATQMNHIFVSGSDFNKMFVGSGTALVEEVFRKARMNKPCLIFIDEADTIIKHRNNTNSSTASTDFSSTTCKLLEELDSMKSESEILVIFATNMDEKFIDKAMLRSGRIDKIFHISKPIHEERKQLFQLYLEDKKMNIQENINLDQIAKLSNGLTGADIKKIINSIKIKKLNEHLLKFNLSKKQSGVTEGETVSEQSNVTENDTSSEQSDSVEDQEVLEQSDSIEEKTNVETEKISIFKKYMSIFYDCLRFRRNKPITDVKIDIVENNKMLEEKPIENKNNSKNTKYRNYLCNCFRFRKSNSVVEIKTNIPKIDEPVIEKIVIDNVTLQEIDDEINKTILGLERVRPVNLLNRQLIAYHETGHAIMSFLLKDTELPTKICISITSKTLGYTMYKDDEENILMNTSINYLIKEVMILYSGRSAEKIFMNEVTCGAENDYLKARNILKRLILNGMLIPELNMITENYGNDENIKIPENIEKIFNKINYYLINKIEQLLNEYELLIKQIAEQIVEKNSISGDDISAIFEKNNMKNKIQSVDVKPIIEYIQQNFCN